MTEDVANSNRMTLLLIAGLPVVMILAATWLWFYVGSGKLDLVGALGTANRGELLDPPLPLQDHPLRDTGGAAVELFAADNAVWRILVPGAAECGQECGQDLYTTRQIRTAMGKYSKRIERIYLAGNRELAQAFPGQLQREHPGLKVLYTSGAERSALWDELAPAERQAAYFLVDPRGWIMMFYPPGTDGKAVMADLKFLLKNSSG